MLRWWLLCVALLGQASSQPAARLYASVSASDGNGLFLYVDEDGTSRTPAVGTEIVLSEFPGVVWDRSEEHTF